MKNLLVVIVAIFVVTACVKPINTEGPDDKWNGYAKYLKMGEQIHTLWAGKHLNVGTVTYGIDDSANFYVTYDCSSSGWLISETHMFAGDRVDMPLNKPGAPKIGHFPNSANHNPRVSILTYQVPLANLPPCTEPGFVVASHCVVHSPAGITETAWAEGDYTFSDKGWGWYDDFYYNQDFNTGNIIYATTYSHDSLRLFHLDITHESVELILVEYVGNSPGTYDATAYDPESGLFFFSKYNSGELYVNQLNEEGPSVLAGYLSGIAASATFYNENYYYVDELVNSINKVTFSSDWSIACESILDTIPGNMTVNDIAMSPNGDFLYIMAIDQAGGNELISWDLENHLFYSMALSIHDGVQIAFGSNGLLYAIAPLSDEGGTSGIYVIDTECDTLTVIEDEIIFIEDPFSDMASGPAF